MDPARSALDSLSSKFRVRSFVLWPLCGISLYQLDGVIGFHFGTDIQSMTAVAFDDTLLLWWEAGRTSEWYHCFMVGTKFVNLNKVAGER